MTLKYAHVDVAFPTVLWSAIEQIEVESGAPPVLALPIRQWTAESAYVDAVDLRHRSKCVHLVLDSAKQLQESFSVTQDGMGYIRLGNLMAVRLQNALDLAEKEFGALPEEYELRVLHIASQNAYALWLHGPREVFVPLTKTVNATLAMGVPALTNDLTFGEIQSKDSEDAKISIDPDYMANMRQHEGTLHQQQAQRELMLSTVYPVLWAVAAAEVFVVQPVRKLFSKECRPENEPPFR